MKDMKQLIVFVILSTAAAINFLDFKHANPVEIVNNSLGGRTPMEGIVIGKGFSSDSKQLASNVCFTATESSNGAYGVVDFSKSVSYEDLSNELGLDFEIKGGYGEFSAGVSASFMKNIRNSSSKISFSFYSKHTRNVYYNYGYGQEKLLNENGKLIYTGGPKDFASLCGDNIITEYEEGSILIMSIVMEFTSKEEKDSFAGGLNFSYSSYAELSFKIKGANERLKQNTSIRIFAEQFGGETTQLNSIIDKSSIKCSLSDMQQCDNVAQAIVNYASNNYPSQFRNGGKYTPLGKFKIEQVKKKGLKDIVPLVTDEILQKREGLIAAFRKIDYYNTKLDEFKLSYPTFTQGSKLLKDFKDTVFKVQSAFLYDSNARKCWDDIPQCLSIADMLLSKVDHKYLDNFYDVHIAPLKYGFKFILRGEKDKNTCLIRNFKWSQDRNYIILMQPGLLGEKALSVEGARVNGNFINEGKVVLALNKEIFPYITSNMELNYTFKDNDIAGEITCTDKVVFESLDYYYKVQMWGSKFVNKYFFEKFTESIF